MKRNIDLIRSILLEAEARSEPWSVLALEGPDRTKESLGYNGGMLLDEGYIEGSGLYGSGFSDVAVIGLTWKGHDLLDAVRDVTVFEKIKTILKTKGLSLTLETVKIAAPFALKAVFRGE